MKFYTQWEPFEIKGEINSGELITEQAGYISPQKQIENMILAGERLNAARMEQFDAMDYDYYDDDSDIPVDPTRGSNYDLADASRDLRTLEAKYKQAEAEYKKAAQQAKEVPPPIVDPNTKN